MAIINETKQHMNEEVLFNDRDEMIVGISIGDKTYACKRIVFDELERKLKAENEIKSIFKNHSPEQFRAKLSEILWKEPEDLKWEASNGSFFSLFFKLPTIEEYKDSLLKIQAYAFREGRLEGDKTPIRKVGNTIKYVAETEDGLKAVLTNFAPQLEEGDYAYSMIIDLDRDVLVYRDNKEDIERIIERKDLI